jgi:uncharacterized protein (DUF2252 family)
MKLPSPDERANHLGNRQRRKMARSAQAYVRGSTSRFYEWLDGARATLPDGPPIWICGDCHYGNLGPTGAASGDIQVQIRDLDQTVIGNPAHDLVRLAFSLASAARGFDLPGVATAELVEQAVDGYQSALLGELEEDADRPPSIKGLMKQSKTRRWKHLAEERIGDTRPTIPLGKRFWPLSPEEREAAERLLAEGPIQSLATALTSRPDDARTELVDAAYWVKGCSSLGLLRFALLVSIGDGKSKDIALLDVKQAIKPSAPAAADAVLPRDNAERIVEGARALSPHLGRRMAAGRILNRSVFVRELLPQDLKLDIPSLDGSEAATMARFLAAVVGRAHARQLSKENRGRWADELGRRRSKTLDAPSWLWNSVVDLMGAHEAAYLEHCRRHARIAA